MSAKGRKSQRRRSTHQHTTPIIQEADIKCVFCDRSDEEVEQAVANKQLQEDRYNRWVECSSCENWMHLDCLDDEMGKIQAPVNDTLWKRIRNFNEWNFTCLRCGERRPIPAQLEFQGIFTREELLSINISEDNLLKRMARDPIIADDWEEKEEEDQTIEQSDRTQNPDVDIETPVPMNEGGIVVQPQEANAGAAAPGLAQNPVNVPSGAFDMTQFMSFMQLQFQQQQSLIQQQQSQQEKQQSLVEKLLLDRDKKEDKDRQERERKDALERQERERRDALEREERERRQREDNERWERLFQSSSSGASSSSPNGQTSKPATLQLPKVQLPRFDGTILKWPEFWDLYDNMVHRNADLPKIQKLSFLKQSLTGQAASVIASYRITEDNYDAVIRKLKDRYDNKIILSEQLYHQLRNLPVSGSKGTELRKTFDAIASTRTQLENLGEDTDHNYILQDILLKFPDQVKQKLNEKKGTGIPWTVQSFCEQLEEYIKVLEETYTTKDSTQSRFTSGEKRPQRFSKPYVQAPKWEEEHTGGRGSGAGLLAAKPGKRKVPEINSSDRSQQKWPCVYCNNLGHYADKCSRVVTIEDRRKFLLNNKRCFVCLGLNHTRRTCSHNRKQKACRGCQGIGLHHESLCERLCQRRTADPASVPTHSSNNNQTVEATRTTNGVPMHNSNSSGNVAFSSPPPAVTCMSMGSKAPGSVLQTALIDVVNIGVGIPTEVKVLLDSGSSGTWISRQLAERLQLRPIGEKKVQISTFNSNEASWITCHEAELDLVTKDKDQVTCVVTIIHPLTATITRQTITHKDKEFLRSHPEYRLAKGTVPEKPSGFTVDLLIGDDYFWEFMTAGDRITLPSGLQLLPSVFGYLVGGRCPNNGPTVKSSVYSCFLSSPNNDQVVKSSVYSCCQSSKEEDAYFTSNQEDQESKLSDLWDLETVGIKDSPTIKDDDKGLERFNDTIRFQDGRYNVTWMWKEDKVDLPDNKGIAWGRFNSLCKRLRTDKDLLQKYNTAIQDQLKKGIIEKVTKESIVGQRMHYLPHHPVISPQKTTTKVRIVYDASAKEKKGNNSLNDCLHRGPVILPDLCGLLLRFRTKPIAILADIEKAFLQIELQMPERDVTRFYWLKDPTVPNPHNNWEIYRFCRVAFGIICSPFLLEATIRYHLDQVGTPLAEEIKNNIYVDNVLILADNLESTESIYKEAKQIFSLAAMNLREWTSNCPEFLETLPEEDRVKARHAKILGLNWNLEHDTIQVKGFDSRSSVPVLTKRAVLHAVAKIFDPLGFFNPVSYHGKMFLHKLWMAGKKWDEPLENDYVVEWQRISHILDQISTVTIHRYIGQMVENYELIIFCDASKDVYAAAVCIRYPVEDQKYQTKLVFSKLRLTTRIKNSKTGEKEPITITRLELLAVWIGVRAANFVTTELNLPIGRRVLFTDSQVVLKWLQSTKTQGTFVQNRVKEIRQTKDIAFRFVCSQDNPTDLMTRGLTIPDLDTFWWNGPTWLNSQEWPITELSEFSTADIEDRTQNVPTDEIILSCGESPADAGILENLDLSRFSSLQKLLRTVVYCIRFITKTEERGKGPVTALELERAENVLVKAVQRTHFKDVIDDIQRNRRNNLKDQLGLYIDEDGFLRCCGRIQHADLEYRTKFPKLLPEHSLFTDLLIQHAHNQIFHYGDSHTLSQTRLKYWIPRGRRAVRKVLRRCAVCKQAKGGSFKLPPVPVLPKERVMMARPFQYIGVDHLGPIYIRMSPDSKEVVKAWICLFTCLVVRAVHLELATDLSAKQFINCFRRFVSRRGKPDKVISDNAPNFKLTKKALDQIWARIYTDPEAMDYFSKKRIQWTFITEMAPWQGGFYERLVGVVKNALRCGLGKKYYSFEEMTTILTEVEAVVNSRPLTFISSNDSDSPNGLIITPAHFLGSRQQIGLPELMDDPEDEYLPTLDTRQQMLQYYGNEQKILNKFWKSWSSDYLLSLREMPSKHKHARAQEGREPQIGEIVLVRKENLPRGRWSRGRIVGFKRRDDGEICNAMVQFSGGQTLTRPINHLYSLEIQPGSNEPMNPKEEDFNSVDSDRNQEEIPQRFQRRAKQVARERIKGQMKDEEIDDEDWLATTLSLCGTESQCGGCREGRMCGSAFFGFSVPTVANVARENYADLHFLASLGVSPPVHLTANEKYFGQ